MTEETKIKIRDTMKARGIRPTKPMDWTGVKRPNSPLKGIKRPNFSGEKHPLWGKEKPQSDVTKEKIRKSLLGRYSKEESPHWISDRSKIKTYDNRREDSNYKIWRKEIWKRDDYQCKINNGACEGRLEAHHILDWESYPELRYVINNGILLCHAHHPRGRAKEKRMVSSFMELLTVSE